MRREEFREESGMNEWNVFLYFQIKPNNPLIRIAYIAHIAVQAKVAPTRVEFLFRVLPGIGALFRVITPHGSVPLRIMSRSCEALSDNP